VSSVEVIMPALGMAQEEGIVLRWLKEIGAEVVQGEPVVEVETDKITVELEAPASGVLGAVIVHEGESAPVGAVIALITAETPAAGTRAAPQLEQRGSIQASPKARRLAESLGVSLSAIAEQGIQPIRAEDVMKAAGIESKPLVEEAAAATPSRAWQTMAQRMEKSWREVPHFSLERTIDVRRLQDWQVAATDGDSDKPSITDLLLFALSRVLPDHPKLNASWQESILRRHPQVNLGVAVATDDALVVPVIQNASELPLPELSRQRRDIVERARAGQLKPEDVQGGTFTLTNLGMYKIDSFHPIINAPQVAILASGRISAGIVLENGLAVARPEMSLTCSCDHRAVDGARAARFLSALAAYLEAPLRINGSVEGNAR
jgi:pyruvate dehydrogenase E2 component (dihydrolipoyllysine-residue acetyltransferase)